MTDDDLLDRIEKLEQEMSRLKRHRHAQPQNYTFTGAPTWGPYPPPPRR